MKMMIVTASLAVCVASPAAARQFVASDAGKARLQRSGRIVISNDATAIRATSLGKQRKTTLVEVRSSRALPRPPVARVLTVAPASSSPRVAASRNVPASLAGIFEEAAQRYGLDPVLLGAVARQESRFRPNAVSPVGAQGVMQLMPKTAASLGVVNPLDARQNIFGGAKYLKMMLDQFRGDVNLSLAAYNAGPGAVRKYRGIPPYRETRNYVASIRRDYDARRRG